MSNWDYKKDLKSKKWKRRNEMEFFNYLDKLNWQSIIGILGICWYFSYDLKQNINKRIDEIEKHQDLQDDRMFLILTGKSLSDAIKEERIKKEKGE